MIKCNVLSVNILTLLGWNQQGRQKAKVTTSWRQFKTHFTVLNEKQTTSLENKINKLNIQNTTITETQDPTRISLNCHHHYHSSIKFYRRKIEKNIEGPYKKQHTINQRNRYKNKELKDSKSVNVKNTLKKLQAFLILSVNKIIFTQIKPQTKK